VFDPQDGWAVVRQFASPPTDNGFTYLWTDGVVADGERLYFIEYGGGRRIRMVDARDGRFLDEWTSDQDTTRVVTGQYDWVNNKVWLGDLEGPAVYRYAGQGQVRSGRLLAAPAGPARSWQGLRVYGQAPAGGRLTVGLSARQAGAADWAPLAGYTDLPAGGLVDLSAIDAALHPWLRLEAWLEGSPGDGGLEAWELEFVPRASLEVARAVARPEAGGMQVEVWVRNLAAAAAPPARLLLERTDQPLPVAEAAACPCRRPGRACGRAWSPSSPMPIPPTTAARCRCSSPAEPP
jgi:hypothetical protein